MFSQPEKNLEQFHVDPGMSVADLGAGTGFYSIALGEMVGESGRVYAVDVQQDLLSKLVSEARLKKLANIEAVWGDIDEPGGSTLNDNIVDRVVVANVLFQVEEKDNLVDEARRILKPNGKVLVVDWEDSFGGLGPTPDDVVKPDVTRTLFESSGFEFDRDIVAGDHHYGMILKKV